MNDALRARISALLASHGWVLNNSVALAWRDHPTAVGAKRVHVYLADFGACYPRVCLLGDYQSEGRNILEPHGLFIARDADDAKLARCVEAFDRVATAAVEASYAARLLHVLG